MRLAANEVATGLALVINMNHGTGRLSPRGHLGKKKGNDSLEEKAKIRKKRV